MTTHCVRRNRWTARLAVLLAILAGLLGLSAVGGPASPAFGVDDGGFAQKMLALVNEQRALNNVAPLQWSDSLGSIAQDGRYDGCGFPVSGRATDMGTRNYFSHVILGCGTQGVPNLLSALGIQSTANGENIAWMSGTTDPILAAQRLTDDMMASPGHRANMLNPDFTHIGIGSWRTIAGQTWSGGGSPLMNVFVAAQVFTKMTTTTTTAPAPTTTVPKTTTTTAPAPTTTVPKTTTTTTTPPAPLPGAPTAVVATGGDGSIAVSWAPAPSGLAVDAYVALVWDSKGLTPQSANACATCRNATVTGVTNGGAYYVTVYAHSAAGWGAPGYSGWVTVAAVPGAPTAVIFTPGNASVRATWQAPTNPGTAIDGYGLFVYDADGYTGKNTWVCSTCTSATVDGLVNGRVYFAAVFAHNPNIWGVPTTSERFISGAPGAPGNVRVVPGNRSAAASWTPAAGSGAPIDAYGIFAYDAKGFTGLYSVVCATCTTGSVLGLVNGNAYTIVVFGHNALGWGTPTYTAPIVPSAV